MKFFKVSQQSLCLFVCLFAGIWNRFLHLVEYNQQEFPSMNGMKRQTDLYVIDFSTETIKIEKFELAAECIFVVKEEQKIETTETLRSCI